MSTGIQLNSTPATPETIKAAKGTVMEILNSKNDQETIRVALKCIEGTLAMPDNIISNCHIEMSACPPEKPIKGAKK